MKVERFRLRLICSFILMLVMSFPALSETYPFPWPLRCVQGLDGLWSGNVSRQYHSQGVTELYMDLRKILKNHEDVAHFIKEKREGPKGIKLFELNIQSSPENVDENASPWSYSLDYIKKSAGWEHALGYASLKDIFIFKKLPTGNFLQIRCSEWQQVEGQSSTKIGVNFHLHKKDRNESLGFSKEDDLYFLIKKDVNILR